MLDEIKEMLKQYNEDKEVEITRDSNLQTELGLSSFDYFAFVSELQDKYSVKIPNKELMEFHTVGDIIDYIEKNKK